MGKLDLFKLGQGGVNVRKAPTQLADSECIQAQNVVFDMDSAEGALRKRGGMPAFTADLTGSVVGACNVPLADSGALTARLYASLGTANPQTWVTSTDGITWTAGVSPIIRAQAPTKRVFGGSFHPQVNNVSLFRNKFWFPSDDYTVGTSDPKLRIFDGTEEFDLATIPKSPVDGDEASWIMASCLHDGEVYLSVMDPSGANPNIRGRVFHLDVNTGAMTQIGQGFSNATGDIGNGCPRALVSFMGQLFVGVSSTDAATPGRVYRIRPLIETVWTADQTLTTSHVHSMAVFKGNLYLGTRTMAATPALLLKRTPSGVYSTADSQADAGDAAPVYAPVWVYDGAIYAHFWGATGANQPSRIMRSTDGVTWASDYNLETLHVGHDGFVSGWMVHNSVLYVTVTQDSDVAIDNFILRRSGGVWTVVYTGNITGYLGVVKS